MNENATIPQSAELSECLSKSKMLLEAGKQKRTLHELWLAEALARGNANALQAVLEVATTFEERAEPWNKAELAGLMRVLQEGIASAIAPARQSAQASGVEEETRSGRSEWRLGALLGTHLFFGVVCYFVSLVLLAFYESPILCPETAAPMATDVRIADLATILTWILAGGGVVHLWRTGRRAWWVPVVWIVAALTAMITVIVTAQPSPPGC